MVQTKSKYYIYQQASLSQKVGFDDPIFQKLAGSDQELSNTIGLMLILCKEKILDANDPSIKLMLALLDVQRKARFATSEKTNEITKLGFMLPKGSTEIDFNDESE